MRDRGTKIRVLNLRHFWHCTALVAVGTSVQALLLWHSKSSLLVTLPSYVQIAWALISLLLLPAVRRVGPIWPGLTYILLTACAPIIMVIDSNIFQFYLLASGIFIAYLCWRQIKQVPKDFAAISLKGCKGPWLAGNTIIDWLLRLLFVAHIASFSAPIVSLKGEFISEKFPGFFASHAFVVVLVVSVILAAGVFLRKKVLVAVGAIINFVYLFLFINESASMVVGASFFDVILTGGWMGFGVSIAFMLVLAFSPYGANAVSPQQISESSSDPDSDLAAFPLKWSESLIFASVLAVIFLLLFVVKPANEQIRNAVVDGDLATVQSLLQQRPELADKSLLEQAIRNKHSDLVEFLAEKVAPLNTMVLNSIVVSILLQDHDIALAESLTSMGFDLTDPEYLRDLVAKTGVRYGEEHIEAIQFLLQHRNERGRSLADFYLPEEEGGSYRSYRFNNPLAIAIERGNLQIIKLLENAGFRCDDEVLAASIATTHPENNLLEYRLKVTNEPALSRPLAFELLVADLSKPRVDRYIGMGIDLTETDAEGNNLFHFLSASATARGNTEYILKQAIEAGCDINADNFAGKKPLWLAVEKNRVDSFKLLLKLGANREITSPDGMTIRAYCEKHGYATLLMHLD